MLTSAAASEAPFRAAAPRYGVVHLATYGVLHKHNPLFSFVELAPGPVEDRSTARLMTRLHRGLRSGQSEITALVEAQREALRNPATAGPFYWAGFVLVGGR